MYRLIFKSKSNARTDKNMVRDILYGSLSRNRENCLTGVLLASRSHYLQVFEGDQAGLNKVFCKIMHDPRHENVKLISFAPAAQRLFSKWAMKGFGLFDMNEEMEARLIEKYAEEAGRVRFPVE